MICSTCLHAIQRTYMNGPQYKFIKNYCDIDGQEIGVQIADCTRLEKKVVYVPPLEPVTPKLWAKIIEKEDAILPPLEEVAKKGGKPRAKRK